MNIRGSAKEMISRKIERGEFMPGQRLPAERLIASELGVSRLTVQNALKELEEEGLLTRQPNCRPVVRRSVPKTVERDQIAIWILPEVQDLGGMLMIQGIRSVLGSANLSILMGCPDQNDAEGQGEIEFLKTVAASPRVAGVIVWELYNGGCKEIYHDLTHQGIALMFIDRVPSYSVDADFVGTDNVQAAREAVRHLIKLGHERIAVVLKEQMASSVQERLQGYRLALAEAELPFDESLILIPQQDSSIPLTQRLAALLKEVSLEENAPTAIFAVNDSLGLHLLEAAKTLEIRVPDELSVMGFDWLLRNLPNGGELTTAAQPFEEIGKAAAERLLERIRVADQNLSHQTPRKILFRAPLVLKGSTARPPQTSFRVRNALTQGNSHAK